MNMSDRTVNELDNAITRRFAMIEVSDYEEDSLQKLFTHWTREYLKNTSVNESDIQDLFYEDYQLLNHGNDRDGGIMQFGPMHYRDVAVFLGQTTSSEGVYEGSPNIAVGEAFRTYILPRLLNSATYSQVDELFTHYTDLNDSSDQFDLQPAIELVENQQRTHQQRMGM